MFLFFFHLLYDESIGGNFCYIENLAITIRSSRESDEVRW